MAKFKVEITVSGIDQDNYEDTVERLEEHIESMGLEAHVGVGEPAEE